MNHTTREVCVFLDVIHVETTFWVLFSAVFTSIVNILTVFTAVIGNAVILYIFWKHERLQSPSNILLGNLCLSDLVTGLIVQPLSVFRRLSEAHDLHFCDLRAVCAYFAVLCFGVSILSIGMISIDRCLAITQPFRYRKYARNSHCLKAVAIVWLFWGVISLLPFLRLINSAIFFELIFAVMVATAIAISVSYYFIVRILRNHRRKIGIIECTGETAKPCKRKTKNLNFLASSLGTVEKNQISRTPVLANLKNSPPGEARSKYATLQVPIIKADDSSMVTENTHSSAGISITDAAPSSLTRSPRTQGTKRPRRPVRRSMREFATKFVSNSLILHSVQRKGANTIAIIVACLVICYLPQTILLLIRGLFGDSADIIYIADTWCDMLLFLNSSINPFVYCYRSQDIKDCIRDILKRKQDSWQIELN